jgi:hypothetical protein
MTWIYTGLLNRSVLCDNHLLRNITAHTNTQVHFKRLISLVDNLVNEGFQRSEPAAIILAVEGGLLYALRNSPPTLRVMFCLYSHIK